MVDTIDTSEPKRHQILLFPTDIVYIQGVRCEKDIVSLYYVLTDTEEEYFDVTFKDKQKGTQRYPAKDLCYALLHDNDIFSLLGYLRTIASSNGLRQSNGMSLLEKQYQDTKRFTDDKTLVGQYLFPHKRHKKEKIIPLTTEEERQLIFPLGCNQSQYTAVIRAFNSTLSIIQGPPGTGKTLTIINFVSNLILRDKTTLIVSNNNEAISNIQEWLERYELGFIVAHLGRRENIDTFISHQPPLPADINSWELTLEQKKAALKEVEKCHSTLEAIYPLQERYVTVLHQLDEIEMEWKHFQLQHHIPTNTSYSPPTLSTKELLDVITQLYDIIESTSSVQSFVWPDKVLTQWDTLTKRIQPWHLQTSLEKENLFQLLIELQNLFYNSTINEYRYTLRELKTQLKHKHTAEIEQRLIDSSMVLFKNALQEKYMEQPRIFFEETVELQNDWEKLVKQYPIILSTTFSATYCTKAPFLYDYVIMDEASQISIETGTLALSCAKRAVIVGDNMQLPGIITDIEQKLYNDIEAVSKIEIDDTKSCIKNSFLQSITKSFPHNPNTFLREHYRSDPQIITFCNEKYYDGQLLIMTEPHPTEKALMVITTPSGDYAHNLKSNGNSSKFNDQEIRLIEEEILPSYDASESLGIITPYNAQVDHLQVHLGGLEISTVHKFQGRERDDIIISCVGDQLNNFTDGTYLVNVAISRAQKHLFLVMSGNKQLRKGNIYELAQYIYYVNYQIEKNYVWAINSYFNTQYILHNAHITNDTTYLFLQDLLARHKQYHTLAITYHTLLKDVLRSHRTIDGKIYVDFIIYNKITHLPLAFIDTTTHPMDTMKEFILKKYDFKLIHLNTLDDNDRQRIYNVLNEGTFFPFELREELSTPV